MHKFNKIILIIIFFGIQYSCISENIFWATTIIDNTSKIYYKNIYEILGKPSITSDYAVNTGLSECAWKPDFTKNNFQGIILGFDTAIKAKSVIIHENINPGAIISVQGFDKNQNKIEIYKNNIPKPIELKGRILNLPIDSNNFSVAAVKIELNNMYYFDKQYQIDAVGLSTIDNEYKVSINELTDSLNYDDERLPDGINSEYNETGPVISSSGNYLYFTRSNHPDNLGVKRYQDIYVAKRNEIGLFTLAQNMGEPINNEFHNYIISVLPDENQILIGNNYIANKTDLKDHPFAISKFNGIKWGAPIPIKINNYKNYNNVGSYCLSPSGKVMVLSISTEKCKGRNDLYVTFIQKDGSWTEPENIIQLNTAGDDITPFLAADETTLYFSTNGIPGYGSNDMFVVRRLDDTWQNWSEPKNLGKRLNKSGWDAFYTIPASGEYAYYVSDKNQKFGTDIYRIRLAQEAKPTAVALISGRVTDKKTGLPLSAKIVYEDLLDGKILGDAISNPENGEFKIILTTGKKYGFSAEVDGYVSIHENIDLTNLEDYAELKKDLILVPIENQQSVILNNIFFNLGDYVLQTQSYSELNKIVAFLNSNPEIKIRIDGHTDIIGTDASNNFLSKNRANAVAEYLISKSIKQNRITTQGWGSKRPIASNQTDEGRQKNRRVEFIILK